MMALGYFNFTLALFDKHTLVILFKHVLLACFWESAIRESYLSFSPVCGELIGFLRTLLLTYAATKWYIISKDVNKLKPVTIDLFFCCT